MHEPPEIPDGRVALGRLLEEHGERLYATIRRLTLQRETATELFQELFLRLGRSLGFVQADDRPAYAFRVAINLALEWRRGRTRDRMESALFPEPVSPEPPPLQHIIDAEQYQQLLDAISELDGSARELVVLRFIEQQPYAAIAQQLGKTPHQVRGLCHAAVRQLRGRLTQRLAHKPAGSLEDDYA